MHRLADELEQLLPATVLEGLRGEADELEEALIAVVETLVASRADGASMRVETKVSEALCLLDDWGRHLERWRANADERVADGLAELRACKDLSEVLDRLCPVVLRAFDVPRAMIARLDADTWSAWRGCFVAQGSEPVTWPGAGAVPLLELPVESAVLRDQRAAAHAAHAPHPGLPDHFRQMTESGPYVIAPLCVSGEVQALLYLSVPTRALTPSSEFAEHAQRFAAGCGRILERELLNDRSRDQQARLVTSLGSMELITSSPDTSVDLVRLVGRPHADTAPAGDLPRDEPSSSWDAALTARERVVMRLLVLGHDNAAIARELAVAPSTVKSHVRGAMRKLGAVNRTELIALHHRAAWRPRSER
jgi:DNA-binding CsgD family transcriptional regulator